MGDVQEHSKTEKIMTLWLSEDPDVVFFLFQFSGKDKPNNVHDA